MGNHRNAVGTSPQNRSPQAALWVQQGSAFFPWEPPNSFV